MGWCLRLQRGAGRFWGVVACAGETNPESLALVSCLGGLMGRQPRPSLPAPTPPALGGL